MDKHKTVERMIEKECQRNSLVELCESWGVTLEDFYECIADKSSFVKVIRCKNCFYSHKYKNTLQCTYWTCADYGNYEVNANGFCYCGEKR